MCAPVATPGSGFSGMIGIATELLAESARRFDAAIFCFVGNQ